MAGQPFLRVLAFAGFLAVLVSCRDEAGISATYADSAGVAIVTSYGKAPLLPWVFDTVRVFGGEETGDATFFRARAAFVDVDTEGRIFVLEPFEHRVVVFDSTGRSIGRMGSAGEGPGEVRYPLSVTAMNTSELYVHDGGGRLVRLAMGQRTGRDEPFPHAVINIALRQVVATPTGLWVWAREPYSGTDTRMDRLLLIVESDTTAPVSEHPSHSTTAHYPRCGMTYTLPQPLAPRLVWSRWGDRLALSTWGGFRVDVFDGNRLAMSLRWAEVSDEPLSRSRAVALLDASGYRGPCGASTEEVIDKHGYYERPQVVQSIAVAPSGRLWVRVAGEAGSRIVVFESDGQILGVLPEHTPMPLTFLPDNRLLVPVADEFDVERIGVVAVQP
jgi:hypothetical protein